MYCKLHARQRKEVANDTTFVREMTLQRPTGSKATAPDGAPLQWSSDEHLPKNSKGCGQNDAKRRTKTHDCFSTEIQNVH